MTVFSLKLGTVKKSAFVIFNIFGTLSKPLLITFNIFPSPKPVTFSPSLKNATIFLFLTSSLASESLRRASTWVSFHFQGTSGNLGSSAGTITSSILGITSPLRLNLTIAPIPILLSITFLILCAVANSISAPLI